MAEKIAMLIDESKCTGCRGCQVACKQWNDLEGWEYSQTVNWGSYENPPRLSPQTWTRILFMEHEDGDDVKWLFFKRGCMHCTEAPCVAVCPTGALKRNEEWGITTLDRDLCNGCGYCTQFCPFHIPRLDVTDLATGEAKSYKCTFCQDRVTNGYEPACTKTCPSGALEFGPWEEMRDKGDARVAKLKEMGVADAHLYGHNILGGLGRLYVLPYKIDFYGRADLLPEEPPYVNVAALWQNIVQPVAALSFVVTGLAALGAFFITRRNIKMEEVE